MYVLRKSFGAWSAGTRVYEVVESPQRSYLGIDGIKVPAELIVKRRNMTRYGPAINSKERRRREREVKKALGINVS